MVLILTRKSVMSLGTTVEEEQISTKDRELRKMYMGEFRLLLKLNVIMMRPLPTTVARYTQRNNTKHTLCTPGSWKRPVKINSVTLFIVAWDSICRRGIFKKSPVTKQTQA
jgi:hypothetical protein